MNSRHHIRYPIRTLERKYSNQRPLDIIRRYFYTYVHALCNQKHVSLRKTSRSLGWHSSYLSCVLVTSGRENKLAKIATYVTRLLKPSSLQIKQINKFIYTILPRLFNNLEWHAFVKQELFWKSLKPLNPVGKVIQESGLSLNQIAKKRHVHYATVYVNLNASRVSWATLFGTADILHISAIKLAKQFHPKLSQQEFLNDLGINLRSYLRALKPNQMAKHFITVKQILKTYLSFCKSTKSMLSLVFKFYLPLRFTLLQGLQMIPKFKHLQKDSPAYTFIKVLKNTHTCEHRGDLSAPDLSYAKIRKILNLQNVNDSIPLNTAKYIERYWNINKPIFIHTNKFYNLKYQHNFHKYQRKMKTMGLNTKGRDGAKLMYFRCVNGIRLRDLGKTMGVCQSRIRQFTFAKEFPLYRLIAAYPQAKPYFLPQRVTE